MGRGKKVKKTKVRVAHELPKRRKMAIQEALAAHQTEDRPESVSYTHMTLPTKDSV